MELEADYSQAATKMQALHKKIRWLWLDRLGHPIADLASTAECNIFEYNTHEIATNLLSLVRPISSLQSRLHADLESSGSAAVRIFPVVPNRYVR